MSREKTGAVIRRKQIYAFGLPIILAQFSQSLTSLIDTAMVASLDDSKALAAVAISSYASFLACAFVLGFSVSVQTLVARKLNESNTDHSFAPLNAGLQLATAIGLLLTLTFYFLAPELMALLNNDPVVNTIATEYFRFRCLSIAAVGFSFSCRGFLNGQKQTTKVMLTLIAIQLSNIFLSYSLIYGEFGLPKLGASGSGLGTTLSIFIGTIFYASSVFHKRWHLLFHFPAREMYYKVLSLSLPNSAQHFLVALVMTLFYYLLGSIGTDELAIGHALINIALFITLPANGFGSAATTLVSQSIGRKDYRDAYQWGWHSLFNAFPLITLLSLTLLAFPQEIIGLFIPQQNKLYELAILPLQLTSLMVIFQAIAIILSQALLGAGDNHRVFRYFTSVQWFFLLPCTTIAVTFFNASINTLWYILLTDRLVQAILFIRLWKKKEWGQQTL